MPEPFSCVITVPADPKRCQPSAVRLGNEADPPVTFDIKRDIAQRGAILGVPGQGDLGEMMMMRRTKEEDSLATVPIVTSLSQ